MSVKEDLVAARALVATGWTQGASALTVNGTETSPRASNAVCWCSVGAIFGGMQHASPDDEAQRFHLAKKALLPGGDPLSQWNDAPGRTQAEVIALFDRAIEEAT